MSGRFASRGSSRSPSPPKSLSPKRRPLHQRSDSEVNERRSHSQIRNRQSAHIVGRDDQENGNSTTPSYSLPKIYTTSPFPAFESQILRPFPDAAAQLPALAGSVATTPAQSPTQTRHATTTTPVIIDNGASSRPHDSFLHDDSVRSSASSFRFPDISYDEAGLTTPASTIRLVDDTPSTSSRHGAMTNFSLPSGLQSRHSTDYSPSISDLPFLPPNQFAATPTPATRQSRPTVRTIANLQSEATQTPGSARSANSSGTQIHRRGRAADDNLPRGSYLHYAEQRVRRSTSDPELAGSSPGRERTLDSQSPSPDVRRIAESPESPNVRTIAYSPLSPSRRAQEIYERWSRSPSSPDSQRTEGNDRFPALTRYVQAAAARSPSPTPHGLRSPRRQFRPIHARWSSVDSVSDMRSMSMSPSEIGSDMGILLEEPSTIESALSVSIASAQPSIRLVEGSGPTPSQAEFFGLEHSTPQRPQTRFREDTVVPDATTNSPVWVSYSSPITHLPHVSESQESLPTPEISRHNRGRAISEASSPAMSEDISDMPSSPNVEIIYPSNSSHDTRIPNMRRRSTMRQTSGPFFTPGSGRGQLRQSTIRPSPTHSPEQSYNFEFGFNPEPTQAATSAFQPSPDPSSISSLTPSEAGTPEQKSDKPWGFYPAVPPPRNPLRPRIPFPVGGSSINNSPESIHIPRNRQSQLFGGNGIGHNRNQTYGGHSPGTASKRSSGSRRSSSPTVPSIDYRDETGPSVPFTPQSHVARPSNPTPGVTPATTLKSPANQPNLYTDPLPESSPIPEIAPLRPPRPKRPKTMSFLISQTSSDEGVGPSNADAGTSNRMHILKHQTGRRDLRDGHINNDWTPHLWHGASHTLNRRSAFIAPSINSASAPFLKGSKSKRDLQMMLFILGFLLPPCWLVASLLPLPKFGQVEGLGALGGGRSERLVKGKSIIGALDLEKEIQWTADEVAGYESARWWRRVNRCLSALGLGVCVVLIVVGVVTSRGGIQQVVGNTGG